MSTDPETSHDRSRAVRPGFVWPPRHDAPADRPVMRADAGAVGIETVSGHAGASVDVTPIAPARIRPARFPRFHAAVLEVESVWLGQTRAPFADRAREAGWMPDAAGAFCPRCGVSCGVHEALDPDELGEGVPLTDAGCPECRGGKLPWHRLVRLGEYQGLLQEVVQEVKFTRWRRLGRDMGRVLGEQLTPYLDRGGVDRSRLAIVPVPIAFWHRFFRGIDHTLALCRGVRDVTGGRIEGLLRRRGGPSQVSVTAAQRRTNVSGSMRIRRGVRPRAWDGWTFVVVDDVKTTGATMTEACKALRRGLGEGGKAARVWAAVGAVAGERPGRRDRPADP